MNWESNAIKAPMARRLPIREIETMQIVPFIYPA